MTEKRAIQAAQPCEAGKFGKMNDETMQITNKTISAYDENSDLKIQYSFTRGWPSKWEASGLNASGNDPIVETLEITHEGLERKKV